tara:strand:- start:875 stop:1465 length:591 start_codon:yes stop_codon:yes gene_type:complete
VIFENKSISYDSTGTIFRDMLFLMVFSLIVIIFILTFLINPTNRPEEIPLRTEILIELTWPSGSAHDVDLWAMGPDNIPVGWGLFAAGPSLNLERDDRGKINDNSQLNYEWISIRDLEPGEYVVNVHLYGTYGDSLPVPVKVKITGKGDLGEIFSGEVMLENSKEEITVARFMIDNNKELIPDSVHNLYRSILSLR